MWSEAEEDATARLLATLAARRETVATAESLTGGLLSARMTDVPGASRSVVGGVVSYATRVKVYGVRDRLDATWGLATTGVAGPDEQDGRPVGTVWVAVAGPSGVTSRQLALGGDRLAIRQATCDAVLADLAARLREVEVSGGEEGGLG